MKHTYKFSIVTAVYNTSEYLVEMIESVINQNIGFEENVQLILIDDGSTDSSLDICREYEKKYPDNIEVLTLNHSGVSAARNKGMNVAKGEYINFLDSDDKLDLNALKIVYAFFEEYYREIDFVAIPLYFFGKEEGNHILNYKFNETKIVDISKNYNYIQLSSSSTFIKKCVLENYKFNEKLIYAEDAELLTNILMRKGKYGVIDNTKYYYRRRNDETSATQGNSKKEWYLDYIRDFSYEMIKCNKQYNNKYEKYIKYLVMYDLQWRINSFKYIKNILNESEYNQLCELLFNIITTINIKIIVEQKNIKIYRKLCIICFKYIKYKWLRNYMLNIL